jgi:hypothetical protein
MQSIEEWASPKSVANIQQFWDSAEKRQERSAVLGRRELLPSLDSREWLGRCQSLLRRALNWAEAARSAVTTLKHPFTVAPILVRSTRRDDGDGNRWKRLRAFRGSIPNLGDRVAPSGGTSLEEIQASRRELGAFCYLKGPDGRRARRSEHLAE